MERINVDVSDLCLWETNPRVEPSIDQMDELNKIYNFSAQSQSTSKRQLMNLASSKQRMAIRTMLSRSLRQGPATSM